MPFRRLLIAAIASGLPGGAFAASPQAFHGDYTVSFLGLTVARANFSSRYESGGYAIEGKVAAAGLARLFDDTAGTVTATGRVSGRGLEPRAFRADYQSGRKVSLIDIRFSRGSVASTRVAPAPKPRGDDWLPLGADDLKDVADPIAATVIRADGPDKVCGRTVRMYDGEMRANLNLVFAGKGEIAVKGYQGPTVTCRLAFEPVSGYAANRKALKFLRNKSRIMVTFAPLGQTGIYAPIRATIGTEIGTITIRARRFEANG